MMKNLLTIFYTLAVLCLGPTPAHAAKYGVASGVSVFPTVTAGSGWTAPTLPDQATTASVGANVGIRGTGNGWGDDVIAGWDNVPYVNMAQPGVVCVLAFQVSGIKSVLIGVDGGAFVPASYTTNGPAKPAFQTTGAVGNPTINPAGEYCVQLNPLTPDGQHEFRAIATPNNGIPRVLQSSYAAVVTANNALLNVGPHGNQMYTNSVFASKQVVVTNPVTGFSTGGNYYIVPGGMTPGGFGLSTAQLGTSLPSSDITCPGSGVPTINIPSTSYYGGQPLGFTYYSATSNWGLCKWTTTAAVTAFNKVYYVCGSPTSQQTPPYTISDSYADATGSCTDLSASYSGVAVNPNLYYYPLVLPGASGTMTLDVWHKGDIENLPQQSGSLFEFTNWNGNVPLTTSYVDSTLNSSGVPIGLDSSSCGTSPVTACATLVQAAENLVGNASSLTFTQTQDTGTEIGGQNGCLIFSRSSNPYKTVGQAVVLSGSNWGYNFTAAGGGGAYGLPKAGYYPNPSGQTFYVSVDAFVSGSHFAVATSPAAAHTPGNCVRWSSANDTTLGSMSVSQDVGGDTIDLMCDNGCPTPSRYVFGLPSGSLVINSNETWLNILPDPAQNLSPNNVQIIGASRYGVYTYKVHLSASVVSPTIPLTLASSISNGATGFTATVAPTLTPDGGTWWLASNGGCFAEGAGSGSLSTQYVFTAPTVTITGNLVSLSGTNYQGASLTGSGCPAGTTVNIVHSFSMMPFTAAGYNYGSLWLDGGATGENVIGPGPEIGQFGIGGDDQYGGQYYTNLNISRSQGGTFSSTFVRDVYVNNNGQSAFNRTEFLIASSSDNIGLPTQQTSTFLSCSANCTSASGTVLNLSAIPPYLKVGYVLDISQSTACHGAGNWITNYTVSPPTITVTSASGTVGNWGGASCPNGTLTQTNSGQHADWNDFAGNGNDFITVNSSMNKPNNALEGYFMQGGPYYDMASINTPMSSNSDLVYLQSYSQNILVANSFIDGAISFRNDISYFANDVYLVGDTFTFPNTMSITGVSRGATYFYNDSCPSTIYPEWISSFGYAGVYVNDNWPGAPLMASGC